MHTLQWNKYAGLTCCARMQVATQCLRHAQQAACHMCPGQHVRAASPNCQPYLCSIMNQCTSADDPVMLPGTFSPPLCCP
eukprot:7555903-Prorocentrum_lima.AAC.1